MAEGDTILRAAQRIEAGLGREVVRVNAGNARGRAAGVERLDRRRLESVDTRGKHLLLRFGDLVLHSHLGMNGSWQVVRRGERWRRPASTAWLTLDSETMQAVQFGGPTLRVLSAARLRRDPVLSRLGQDVLAADFDLVIAVEALRSRPDRELGDALLDQHLIAGIGNIFKSEACFAAGTNPWSPIADLSKDELGRTLEAARLMMRKSVELGRPEHAVYRRYGKPCLVCGTRIAAHGQGDANRRTYWCPHCQAPRLPGALS